MFKRHLWPAIQWICGRILQLWSFLVRPFRRRSYTTELPLASPVVPSTPSFIQSQEPNFTFDAMRIFQLNDGPARESRLARNKLAVQQIRGSPPNINRIASFTSTDPSPGFSLLNGVVDNLVTDSLSQYSSPPSSPSSSLHTPCIVVSGPMDNLGANDARSPLDRGSQLQSPISEAHPSLQGESPISRHTASEIYGLAKRRNFKGAPIITNISRDLLPFPTTRLTQGNVTPTDLNRQQSLSRPKSALAVVTDFVRASAHMPPRNLFRDALVVSPESQSAYTQSSPFSADGESFFIDDHLSSPPEFNIHDLGIYTDMEFTLNLQVPRRKRMVVPSEPLRRSASNYKKPILAKRLGQECRRAVSFSSITDISHKKTRTPSGISHLTEVDISSADVPHSPASFVSFSVAASPLDVQEAGSSGLSIRENESDNEVQHIPPIVEYEDPTVPSRTSLYASLIFPFSLEDSVSWDTSLDFQHNGVALNRNVLHREDACLTVMTLGDTFLDGVDVLGRDQARVISSGLSDHQGGNLPPPLHAANTGDDVKGDDIATHHPLRDCSAFFSSNTPSSVSDRFFAGSNTSTTLEVTVPLLDVQDSGLCQAPSDTARNLRHTPLRQVGVLDGLFVSSGDPSLLPHLSESTFCVGGSQTFSSLMSVDSIDRNVPVPVNNRRARRIGFYGPPSPPLVTPDLQDDPLSDVGERLDRSSSERRRNSTRLPSRPGSALRPLVLPMRVAIRELSGTSAGDRSFERAPDTLLQSNRNSIGFPPAFPLPELPAYQSSTSPFVASSLPRFEHLDALQPSNASVKSPIHSEPFSAYSMSEFEESFPDHEGEGSVHTVNWGVAF